jgi:hypothetical protein
MTSSDEAVRSVVSRRSWPVSGPQRMARLLIVDMTTGVGLGAGIVVLGFSVVVGLTTSLSLPSPSWSNPFNLALMGLLYLAPLCAGVVTWMVQDYVRRAVAVLAVTSRGSTQVGVVPRVVAMSLWGLIGYLTMLLLFSVRTPRYGVPEGPALLLGVLAIVLLMACVVVGWSVGSLTLSRLAAPAVTLGLFGFMYTVSYLRGWPRRLAPIDPDTSYQPFLQPHVRLVLAQLVLLLGVAALASGGLARRPMNRLVAGAVGVLTLLGSIVWLSHTDPSATELRGAPKNPVCANATIHVCLRPEDAAQLRDASTTLDAAVSALEPYMSVPRRFSEPGMDINKNSGPGVFVPVTNPTPDDFLRAAIAAILPAPCPATATDDAQTAYRQLYIWAEIRAAGGTAPTMMDPRDAIINTVLTEDTAHQRMWVQEHLKAARSCDL